MRSVYDGLVADGLIAYGCGMIRSVDNGLVADGLIAYGCPCIRRLSPQYMRQSKIRCPTETTRK